MRYSYGVSASLRLNCWLQWPHLATKIHRRGLEFTEKARNIHRVRLVFDSSGLSILGTTMFDEYIYIYMYHKFTWLQSSLLYTLSDWSQVPGLPCWESRESCWQKSVNRELS